jgi:hypothetical protein
MHYSQILSLLCLSAVSRLVSGAAIAQPASVERRSIQLGWSLQASTCPSGSTSCGSGACCPSSLFCIANANDEVDACCTTSRSCCLLLNLVSMLISLQIPLAEVLLKEIQSVLVSCYTFPSRFQLPWPPSCCLDKLTPFGRLQLVSVERLPREWLLLPSGPEWGLQLREHSCRDMCFWCYTSWIYYRRNCKSIDIPS